MLLLPSLREKDLGHHSWENALQPFAGFVKQVLLKTLMGAKQKGFHLFLNERKESSSQSF